MIPITEEEKKVIALLAGRPEWKIFENYMLRSLQVIDSLGSIDLTQDIAAQVRGKFEAKKYIIMLLRSVRQVIEEPIEKQKEDKKDPSE